jgi:hypothetical protein
MRNFTVALLNFSNLTELVKIMLDQRVESKKRFCNLSVRASLRQLFDPDFTKRQSRVGSKKETVSESGLKHAHPVFTSYRRCPIGVWPSLRFI